MYESRQYYHMRTMHPTKHMIHRVMNDAIVNVRL
jgi:hypothetical protein